MINETAARDSLELHPLFAGILRQMSAIPLGAERAQYESALRSQDWMFEFSDDHATYQRGLTSLRKLREQQARIDPSGAIWLSIAPPGHGVPRPVVAEVSA